MGHFQKILLLVLVVPLALFPGGLITYILLFEIPKFEDSMWVPIAMSALGICSFAFHFKSKKFYKLLKKDTDLPKIEVMFWVLDIAFGMAYILMALYISYLMYKFPSHQKTFAMVAISLPMLIAGSWIVFEAFYLHKMIQIHKFAHRHSEIDEINGTTED